VSTGRQGPGRPNGEQRCSYFCCCAVSGRLFLSEGAISKYTTTTFAKLGLAADNDTNRRVQAVLAYVGTDT
jgi:hypothetical protein